jgi:hypothetical protein
MSIVPEKRQPKASAKLKDANNRRELQVKSHQHVRNAAIAEAEASAKLKAQTSISTTVATAQFPTSSFPSTTKRKQPPPEVLDSNDEADTQSRLQRQVHAPRPLNYFFSMYFYSSFIKKTTPSHYLR